MRYSLSISLYFKTLSTFVSSSPVTRRPQGHTPSAFLFLSTTMSISRGLTSRPFAGHTLSGVLSDRQTLAPVSHFREAGWFSRSLQISYGGIGAEAPVSLSDWVYMFSPMKVSSVLFDFFQDSFRTMKKLDILLTMKTGSQPGDRSVTLQKRQNPDSVLRTRTPKRLMRCNFPV